MKRQRQPLAGKGGADSLARYRQRRDFAITTEPDGDPARQHGGRSHDAGKAGETAEVDDTALTYVMQKHGARRLHYDLRLELAGVLLSWAVPKGPSLDPTIRRLAIRVEDHPLDYGRFEGRIPDGQYGAGRVIVWDSGTWEPLVDPDAGLEAGKLVFRLHGQKLAGDWELIRPAGSDKPTQWLLFKKRDRWARASADFDVASALPDSVIARPLGPARSLPDWVAPQLATLVSRPPTDGGWSGEPKIDGYRLLTRLDGQTVRLLTRNGLDWTAKFPAIAASLRALGWQNGWLDGEVTVAGATGLPDFGRLQDALARDRTDEAVLFLFDVLYLDGQDLRDAPLRTRRRRLAERLAATDGAAGNAGNAVSDAADDVAGDTAGDRASHTAGDLAGNLRLCDSFDAAPAELFAAATRLGLEGLILKRPDAPYRAGRSNDWLKLKRQWRQDFVILGYRLNAANPGEVGALLLGYHEGGRLRAAGSVGTGWDAARARWLREQLESLVVASPPVDPASIEAGLMSRGRAATTRWLRPTQVAEIAFAGWTRDGHVRQAVFLGLRSDLPASEVEREDRRASPEEAAEAAQEPAEEAQVTTAQREPAPARLTHPDRVIDPQSGLTKADLFRYYDSVADWILPHLVDRPVSLLRAPDGVGGKTFFQRHPFAPMPGVRELDPQLWPDHEPLMAIDTRRALLSAVQMNVIELHTWNATIDAIDRPDRLVFDLDPGDGVELAMLKDGCLLVRTLLDELGLASWLKTTGGKGLHIVVPIAARWPADRIKAFSKAVVEHLARVVPTHFVAKSGPSRRVGRIFVDYLRNGATQTTVSAFSARARPGLGVSMPIGWGDLEHLDVVSPWSIANARDHLSLRGDDPWQAYWQCQQGLTGPARRLTAATGSKTSRRRSAGTKAADSR